MHRAGLALASVGDQRPLHTCLLATCILLSLSPCLCLCCFPHPKALFLCLDYLPSFPPLPVADHPFISLLVPGFNPQSPCTQRALCAIHRLKCWAYEDEKDTAPPSQPGGGHHARERHSECWEGGTPDVQGRDFLPGRGDIVLRKLSLLRPLTQNTYIHSPNSPGMLQMLSLFYRQGN